MRHRTFMPRKRRNSGGLTKAKITKAVRDVEEMVGDRAADKLIVLAVARGAKDDLAYVKQVVKREYREVPKGLKVGRIFKAQSIAAGYYAFDADLVGVLCDSRGVPYTYFHTGDYHPVGPKDVILTKATFLDENAEPVSVSDAVEAAIEAGSRRWNGRGRR